MDYYDWTRTRSYAADVTMVAGARGVGKTYGARLFCTRDYLRGQYRWVEICRYKNELSDVMDGYFDKISAEFPGKLFKTGGSKGYIADKPAEGERPAWEVCCYFVALTDAQNAKKRTYVNVKSLLFDEAILDRTDRYHRYVPNEYAKLANIVDTCTRERPDSNMRPHVYLLGNACDLLNPYFAAYGIDRIPEYGYHWYRNKTVLVHYADPGDYADAKLESTVSGRMTAGTAEGEIAARNAFTTFDDSMIADKPARAEYVCGLIAGGERLGVWSDYAEGYIYVNDKMLEGDDRLTYYITRADQTINRLAATRAAPGVVALRDAHYANCIKYNRPRTMDVFLDIMSKYGL